MRSYFQIYTGSGTCRDDATLGLAFRAAGHNLKTLLVDFNDNSHNLLNNIPNKLAEKIVYEHFPVDNTSYLFCNLLSKVQNEFSFDLLILKNISPFLKSNVIDVNEIMTLIDIYKNKFELILTGPEFDSNLIDQAELVTKVIDLKQKNNIYKNQFDATSAFRVITGNGKGKTTCSLGFALKNALSGKKTEIIQFMKGNLVYGELISSKLFKDKINIVQKGRDTFVNPQNPDPVDVKMAEDALDLSFTTIKSGAELIILDEINVALKFGLINKEKVIELIKTKQEFQHLIFTGRWADENIIKLSDITTEMGLIKHYFDNGVDARDGIER